MGVFGEAAAGIGDADIFEGLFGDVDGLFSGDVLMEENGFEDLVADGVDGVEAGHGFLEDHGDFVAADGAHCFFVVVEEVLALEVDGAAVVSAGGRGDELECAHGGDGFAAAGFANDGEGLLGVDGHVDFVDGVDDAGLGIE